MRSILEQSSFHAVYDESILDALRFAREHGFAGIQLAVESPHLSFERISCEECGRIAEFARANGLRVTIHAPDTAVSLFETSLALREGSFQYFEEMFAFAERIGSPLVTVHPGKISTFGTDTNPRRKVPSQDLPLYRQAFDENLRRLIAMNRRRVILCLENFGMDVMVREIAQPYLDTSDLHLCWDLAKSVGDGEVEAFFWKNIDRIRQVHLHDAADGVSHRAVGTGTLDFMRYLPRLAKANVVDFCHEVRPREKAIESLNGLRRLIEMNWPTD